MDRQFIRPRFRICSVILPRPGTYLLHLFLISILLNYLLGLRLYKSSTSSPCALDAPHDILRRARIAKVSVVVNDLHSKTIWRALQTHRHHNQLLNYREYLDKSQLVEEVWDRFGRPSGAWSKPAYLLTTLDHELSLPKSERVEWLFWFDPDTIIANPYTPLEIFVPPRELKELDSINLIITSNFDGLNSGAFAIRVHPWSVSFMAAVLAYPVYLAENVTRNEFQDQSAFSWLLEDQASPLANAQYASRDRWVVVPTRWFNSLPINNGFFANGTHVYSLPMTSELFDAGTEQVLDDGNDSGPQPWKVMQGDLAVHFAGSTKVRDSWMIPWLDRLEAKSAEWANKTSKMALRLETQQFWNETVEIMKKLSNRN